MDQPIRLTVEETFTISGRGLVAVLGGETKLGVGKPHKVKVDAMKYGVNWIQNHVGLAAWNFLVTHFLNHIIHHEI